MVIAAPQDATLAFMRAAQLEVDMRAHGATGLRQAGGYVVDEPLRQLQGITGQRVYREMRDNDALCGGICNAIDKLVRQVAWSVEPASQQPFDREAADFLESCLHDMQQPWTEVIAEAMSMLPCGFSAHEIVYKRRGGNAEDASMHSEFNDGRIGWRGFPIRAQDTITRWHFSPSGEILGFDQLAPPLNRPVTIPMRKALLFRTSTHKNNPEGISIFRAAYRSWYFKSRIENYEAVGIERDVAGIPKAFLPPEIMSASAPPEMRAQYDAIKNICANLRQGSMASMCLPAIFDPKSGERMLDIELMTSGGAKQFDVDKVIQRYDQRIAMSMLADFLLMGQSAAATGSFAMHTDKSKLFLLAVTTFLDIITEVFNDSAVKRLFHLNALPVSRFPKLKHGPIEAVDLKELAAYLTALAGSGMPLFPDPALENALRDAAKLPHPLDQEALDYQQKVEPAPGTGENPPTIIEHHDAADQESINPALDMAHTPMGETA